MMLRMVWMVRMSRRGRRRMDVSLTKSSSLLLFEGTVFEYQKGRYDFSLLAFDFACCTAIPAQRHLFAGRETAGERRS